MLSAHPYGDGCRKPHPGFARFRPYRASILSPLAHRGPARSACSFCLQTRITCRSAIKPARFSKLGTTDPRGLKQPPNCALIQTRWRGANLLTFAIKRDLQRFVDGACCNCDFVKVGHSVDRTPHPPSPPISATLSPAYAAPHGAAITCNTVLTWKKP